MRVARLSRRIQMVWGVVLACATMAGVARSGAASADVPAEYSAGVADIVRMVEAKVDMEVIKAYIRSAPIAYSPKATEIIALKERGVPSEVMLALLQRGAEVRAQMASGGGAAAASRGAPPGSRGAEGAGPPATTYYSVIRIDYTFVAC